MHMAWVRATCGRIKSDFRYSGTVVYNNFPWPLPLKAAQKAAIDVAASAVLAARKVETHLSLDGLYDADTMPKPLRAAHAALDKVVDAAYCYKGSKDDAARVAFLFERYQMLDSALKASVVTAKAAGKPRTKAP